MSEPPSKAPKMMQDEVSTNGVINANVHVEVNGTTSICSEESKTKSAESENTSVGSYNGSEVNGHTNGVSSSTGPREETPEVVGDGSILKYKKLSDKAITPTRGSKYAAGFDLYSAKDVTIASRGKALVPTDISIALPEDSYGRIAPRSSLAWKHHIDVGAGVIDMDYRGPVGVVLYNLGENSYTVKEGERVAQLVVEKIFMPKIEEVKELPSTERGAGGYGSTGK